MLGENFPSGLDYVCFFPLKTDPSLGIRSRLHPSLQLFRRHAPSQLAGLQREQQQVLAVTRQLSPVLEHREHTRTYTSDDGRKLTKYAGVFF